MSIDMNDAEITVARFAITIVAHLSYNKGVRFLKNLRKISALCLVSMIGILVPTASAMESRSLATEVDGWLDSNLQDKKQGVLLVLDEFRFQGPLRIPGRTENDDFGFSFPPQTEFDLMCLSIIKAKKGVSIDRVPFVDLGCGLGQLSTFAVFAGARVDAVDLRETVTKANIHIFNNTKRVIGYTKEQSKIYYRAFPESLVMEKSPMWTQTPHQVAYCSNVVHFFNENEIQLFAQRIFKNMTTDGVLFVQTDTPLISDLCLKVYKERRESSKCPGLAIYNKKQGTGGLAMVGNPIPYEESVHTVRLGQKYPGEFTESGKVIENNNIYHNVKNLFLVEELAHIFAKSGFKVALKFYINDVGAMITEEGQLPEIGKPSKACVIFIKN